MANPRWVLRDLTPGKEVAFQVRSKNAEEIGPWSSVYRVMVDGDVTPPAAVSNLELNLVGSSFILTWIAPTTNQDGSSLEGDLKYYKIRVQSPVGEYTHKVDVGKEEFEYTLQMNTYNFGGTPQGNLTFFVSAVDFTDNEGPEVSVNHVDLPPPVVSNLLVTGSYGGVSVSWDAVDIDDLLEYRVYASKTDSNFSVDETTKPNWSGLTTAAFIDSFTPEPIYVRVAAVDVFGQFSLTEVMSGQPMDPTSVDVEPPGSVTNVIGTPVISGSLVNISLDWTDPADFDLGSYRVRYSTSASGPWSIASFPVGASSPKAILRGLPVGVVTNGVLTSKYTYYVQVKPVDLSGNEALNWAAAPPINLVSGATPASIKGLTAVGGLQTVSITWEAPKDTDPDFGSASFQVEIYRGVDLVASKTTSTYFVSFTGLAVNTQYTVRVRAVSFTNVFGEWVSANFGTGTAGAEFRNGIPGDLLVANTVAGNRIIAGTLDADRLTAGSAFINDLGVKSNLTVDTNGSIRSANFSDTGQVGYELGPQGLKLFSGSIAARLIQVQQSSQNLVPAAYADFEFSPSYYSLPQSGMSYSISGSNSRFGQASLQLNSTAANAYIYLATGNQYEISVDEDGTYIYSMYVWNPGTTAVNVVLSYGYANGSQSAPTTVSCPPGWTRAFMIATVPIGVARLRPVVSIPEASRTIFIDGVQIERQMGATTAPSQWTAPSVTIIDGAMIRTGEIRSNAMVSFGGSTKPAWSLSMSGGLQVSDALVRGRLIVGSGTDTLSSVSVASYNYFPNSAGWAIRGDGFAEFSSGIFRGTINATGGHFSGNITSSGSISGGAISGSSIMTTNFNTGAVLFQVNPQGAAFFEGDIRATLFRSTGSTWGFRRGSYIEIGNSETSDPVDEIRFFVQSGSGTRIANIRNPSAWPGSLRFTVQHMGVLSAGHVFATGFYHDRGGYIGTGGSGFMSSSTTFDFVFGVTNGATRSSMPPRRGSVQYPVPNGRGTGVFINLDPNSTSGTALKSYSGYVEARNRFDTGFARFKALSFFQESDIRHKSNIEQMLPEEASNNIKYMRPTKYRLPDNAPGMGFLADELPTEFLSLDSSQGTKSIDLYSLVTTAIAALQGLESRVTMLELTTVDRTDIGLPQWNEPGLENRPKSPVTPPTE